MAVTATGSRHSRSSTYIILIMVLGWGLYSLYDGYKNEKFQKEHTGPDGKPDSTLVMNRVHMPIGCGIIAIGCFVMLARIKQRRIVADEQGVRISGGPMIAYAQIQKIDKRFFEKEGHFTIEYTADGAVRSVKFKDAKYDGLGLVLDEIVRRTGAEPEKQEN